MAVKIKKNDMVLVLGGKDKGKKGKVLKVFPSERKAVVENVKFIKKHMRPNPRKNVKGGIIEREGPVDISNLLVLCPECDRPVKVSRIQLEDRTRIRICKKCKGVLDK